MKKFLVFALLLLIPTKVFAQSTNVLSWDYVGVVPSVVATYTQGVVVDTTAVTNPITCVAKGTVDTTCQVNLPAFTAGSHNITVTALLNGMTASSSLNNVDLSKFPKTAVNVTVVIKTVVTVP